MPLGGARYASIGGIGWNRSMLQGWVPEIRWETVSTEKNHPRIALFVSCYIEFEAKNTS